MHPSLLETCSCSRGLSWTYNPPASTPPSAGITGLLPCLVCVMVGNKLRTLVHVWQGHYQLSCLSNPTFCISKQNLSLHALLCYRQGVQNGKADNTSHSLGWALGYFLNSDCSPCTSRGDCNRLDAQKWTHHCFPYTNGAQFLPLARVLRQAKYILRTDLLNRTFHVQHLHIWEYLPDYNEKETLCPGCAEQRQCEVRFPVPTRAPEALWETERSQTAPPEDEESKCK